MRKQKFGWNGGSEVIVPAGGESIRLIQMAQDMLDKYRQVEFIDNLLSNDDNFLNDPVCQKCIDIINLNEIRGKLPEEALLHAFNLIYKTNLVLKVG